MRQLSSFVIEGPENTGHSKGWIMVMWDLIRFSWRPTSMNAMLLMVELEPRLTDRDL